MSEKSLTHGIKFKDKIGYAMGDMGGLLTFSLIGAFQNKFYTDVLHIQPAKIVVLILVARLWDAINDPIWGAFIDSRKPTKQGKFRPYVFWFSIPLAVSAVLMFTVIPNLSEAKYLLFAYITYILYGMMYTCVNIPYGSLASVVTDDEKERSSLSMWRSIGAGLGGLPSTILFPMLVYNTTIAADGTKIQTLDGNKLTIGVLILAILSVLIFFGHYKLTKERIAPIQKKKGDWRPGKEQTVCDALPGVHAADRVSVLLSSHLSVPVCGLLPQRPAVRTGDHLHLLAHGHLNSYYEQADRQVRQKRALRLWYGLCGAGQLYSVLYQDQQSLCIFGVHLLLRPGPDLPGAGGVGAGDGRD